jgi:hypothetical protein
MAKNANPSLEDTKRLMGALRMKLKPHLAKGKRPPNQRSRSLPEQTSASLLHQRLDDCRDAK